MGMPCIPRRRRGDAVTEALDTRLAGYLVTNRNFLAPVVDRAIATLRLPAGAWVLDAGTGAGGALPPLARAVGAAGRVRAVDVNPAVAPLATTHADQAGMADRVSVDTADLLAVLDAATTDPTGGFDAIWASDVVWPGNFDDPAATVAAMARALRPGGVVALYTSNYYESSFLPAYSRLERLVRAASEQRWDLPPDGPHHHNRHLAWLQAAGLDDIGLRGFPRIGFPIGGDSAVREYLEKTVWPEMLESATTCGREVGMSDAEVDELRALISPGSASYVADEPGYYVHHPTLLATGRRRGGRG